MQESNIDKIAEMCRTIEIGQTVEFTVEGDRLKGDVINVVRNPDDETTVVIRDTESDIFLLNSSKIQGSKDCSDHYSVDSYLLKKKISSPIWIGITTRLKLESDAKNVS